MIRRPMMKIKAMKEDSVKDKYNSNDSSMKCQTKDNKDKDFPSIDEKSESIQLKQQKSPKTRKIIFPKNQN